MSYLQRLKDRKVWLQTNRNSLLSKTGLKNNCKLFAQNLGIRVPKLYWMGSGVNGIPFDLLPNTFVIKPNSQANAKHVFVIEKVNGKLMEKFSGHEVTLASMREEMLKMNYIMIVEEYIKGEPIPFDYKLFSFREEFAGALAIDRRNKSKKLLHWFDANWNTIAPINTSGKGWFISPSSHFPKPVHLQEMLDAANKITTALNTFTRVDMYDTEDGAYLGETCSIPNGAGGITPESDIRLGQL